jgi:hypothetical protein
VRTEKLLQQLKKEVEVETSTRAHTQKEQNEHGKNTTDEKEKVRETHLKELKQILQENRREERLG